MGHIITKMPWQLFVPLVFSLSIGCIYYAITLTDKPIIARFPLLGFGISGILVALTKFAEDTGYLAQYLWIIESMSVNAGIFCISFIILMIGAYQATRDNPAGRKTILWCIGLMAIWAVYMGVVIFWPT